MKFFKPLLFTFLCVALVAFILFFAKDNSYPNYKYYQKEFQIDYPLEENLLELSLFKEGFHDSRRWKFRLTKDEFKILCTKLKADGWHEWKELGGSFGSFNEDSYPDNPLLHLEMHSALFPHTLHYYYRPSTGHLNAIAYPN